MLEAAIEVGADNCESDASGHVITCQQTALHEVAKALEQRFGEPKSAKFAWVPKNTVPVSEEAAAALFKLIEALEEDDDVQQVTANFEVSDEVMQRLSA